MIGEIATFEAPEEIMVGMGQYAVTHSPKILVSLSLGSCIGLAVYERERHVGGLAHVMLPNSKECTRKKEDANMNKFADICITKMIKEMKSMGCSTDKMTAKIIGGAHMFPGIIDTEIMDIGKKNEAATREELNKFGIKTIASETGGNIGRTIRFDTTTGIVTIKTKDAVSYI